MSVHANLFSILYFSVCVSLYSLVLLILEYNCLMSTLLVLLFESVSGSNSNFGLLVRVKISISLFKFDLLVCAFHFIIDVVCVTIYLASLIIQFTMTCHPSLYLPCQCRYHLFTIYLACLIIQFIFRNLLII